MAIEEILKDVELFQGLNPEELGKLAVLFQEKQLAQGETLAEQGSPGDALHLVSAGFVQVALDNKRRHDSQVLVNLGKGQIIGEMSLVDQGPRSATVRAISDPTVVHTILRKDFEALCENDTRIGYIVMRNIAADLSFKLRQRNLVA